MIWNTEFNKEKSSSQCVSCSFFDKKLKKCNGFGKKCFEIDPKTMTLIDPVTKQSFKKENING